MSLPFTHLHVHSDYSLLDGLSKIDHLLSACREHGMKALALTDHGALHGAIEFYTKAKKAGIKPIVGMEGYLAQRSRFDKEAHVDVEPYHILLLAKNETGYKNLIKLSTLAHLEGFYYKPRMDHETLRQFAEGLIVTSGCPDGEIPRAILNNQWETAKKLVKEYLDIFGSENFYFEVQNHQLSITTKVREGIFKLAREFDRPIIATNDVHYVEPLDALAQDALLAIQTKEFLDTPKRKLTMRESPTFYFRTPAEMEQLFYDCPQVLENTQRIVDAVNLEIAVGKFIFPEYELPLNVSAEQLLKEVTYRGACEKFGENLPPTILERLKYELEIITKKNYSTYFLIFADFARFCRERQILINTRGSAAGSLVLYVLGVTTLNPLDYQLPFERFLYLERVSPPDIDLDVADNRREELIEYVVRKYGQDHVAQIVTFGSMEPRAAVRDVGRVMGISYAYCDRLAKMIPFGYQGKAQTFEHALEVSPEFKNAYENEPEAKRLIDLAKRLEGCKRHASTHAAGVIIADLPITEYVPLMRESKGQKIITQYDMYSLDLNVSENAIGLLKMDLLGIRNLTILSESARLVKERRGIELDLDNLGLDDEKTYQMLAQGETTGVFQFEGSGMRRYLKELGPGKITDLMAMVALFRPGPMEKIPEFIARKHNPKLISFPDPRLEKILAASYGVITYQDDVLLTAITLAGYSWVEVDKFRKAIGKKIKALMSQQKEKFIDGCVQNGLTREKAEEVFRLIEPFAGYGFNKAHAASYARLAYQTAFMKANFPVEFMTAILSAERGNQEKVSLVVAECRRMGIKVLGPDINLSGVNFTIEDSENPKEFPAVRFGLTAVKNVGEGASAVIVENRSKNGPFSNLTDFCQRVNLFNVNKKVLESLIKVGALDAFESRAGQLMLLPDLMEEGQKYQKNASRGLLTLFGESTASIAQKPPSAVAEMPPAQLLLWEKELLGFYLSAHPQEQNLARMASYISHQIADLSENEIGSFITVGGMITGIKKFTTRRDNQEMAFVKISDGTGVIETIVFPKIFQNGKQTLLTDQIVLVQGRLDRREEEDLKVIAEKIFVPDLQTADKNAKI